MAYILSPQDVRIAQAPASIGARIGALLVDAIIVGLMYYMIITSVQAMAHVAHWVVIFFLVVAPLFYPLVCETAFNGQTMGKFLFNIRVITLEGSGPKLMSFFLRWFMLPFDLFFAFGLGELCVFFTKRQQRLGDLIAGTWVVRTKTHASTTLANYTTKDQTTNTPLGSKEQQTTNTQHPTPNTLTPRQAHLLDQALSYSDSPQVAEALEALRPKVERIVGYTLPTTTEAYLQQVLREYREASPQQTHPDPPPSPLPSEGGGVNSIFHFHREGSEWTCRRSISASSSLPTGEGGGRGFSSVLRASGSLA